MLKALRGEREECLQELLLPVRLIALFAIEFCCGIRPFASTCQTRVPERHHVIAMQPRDVCLGHRTPCLGNRPNAALAVYDRPHALEVRSRPGQPIFDLGAWAVKV